MNDHLRLARLKIEAACKMVPHDEHIVKLEEAMYCLLLHLEAQPQEAPQASETSSAPTTGPVTKRYGSATASLDTSQGQFLLTVETTDSFKSALFTWEEWAAIRQLCLTPQQIRESLTPSGENKAGARGPAAPDSPPAPSSEAREHEHRWTLVMDDGEGMPYRQCRHGGCGLVDRPPFPSQSSASGRED